MASYLVVNAKSTALLNVNAAGDDVPAYSAGKDGLGTAIVLSGAEAETLMAANNGVILIASASTTEQKRLASKILRLGRNPGTATAEV